jgi:hypothetical protein
MPNKILGKCIGCGQPGKFSIIVAAGPNNNPVEVERLYIPNETVREHIGTGMDVSREAPFCAKCMRAVEDNFRATIMYLQSENNLLAIAPVNPN